MSSPDRHLDVAPIKSTTQSNPPDGTWRWWALAFIGLAQLMVVLDGTIVNIAMPAAQQELGFTDGQRQWVVTAYALTFGSLLLLGGRISDLFGRRSAFLVGLVGFAGASVLAGGADSFAMLVAARAVQGGFGALLAPAALSLVTTTFTDIKERAKAFSIYGSLSGAGGAVGLLLGGVLTEYASWRWTLYVNVIFALIAFAGAWRLLPRTPGNRAIKLDLPGTVLASWGLFSLVFGFASAESHGWNSPATWGVLLAGVVLLSVFAWWQTKSAHPVLPLRILTDRNRGASFVALLIASMGVFGIFLFLTYYVQLSLGYSAVMTGVCFLPMIGAITVGATIASNVLGERVGPGTIVSLGMGSAAAGLAVMATFDLDSGYVTQILPALLLAGFGIGLVLTPAQNQATAGVAPDDAGAASASVNAMQQIGGSIGTALLTTVSSSAVAGYVLDHDTQHATAQAYADLAGYQAAFLWSSAFFAVGMVISLLLYRRGVRQPDVSIMNANPVVTRPRGHQD